LGKHIEFKKKSKKSKIKKSKKIQKNIFIGIKKLKPIYF